MDRIQKTRKILSKTVGDKKVVELGSGRDFFIADIPQAGNVTTIDFDKAHRPDVLHDLSKGIPLADESVDVIVACEIIEHVYQNKKLIGEIHRVLKGGGVVVLSVPNICYWKYRIAFMLGKIPSHAAKADMTYGDGKAGHVRDWCFKDMESVLKSCGFDVVEATSETRFVPHTFGRTVIIRAVKK